MKVENNSTQVNMQTPAVKARPEAAKAQPKANPAEESKKKADAQAVAEQTRKSRAEDPIAKRMQQAMKVDVTA